MKVRMQMDTWEQMTEAQQAEHWDERPEEVAPDQEFAPGYEPDDKTGDDDKDKKKDKKKDRPDKNWKAEMDRKIGAKDKQIDELISANKDLSSQLESIRKDMKGPKEDVSAKKITALKENTVLFPTPPAQAG